MVKKLRLLNLEKVGWEGEGKPAWVILDLDSQVQQQQWAEQLLACKCKV